MSAPQPLFGSHKNRPRTSRAFSYTSKVSDLPAPVACGCTDPARTAGAPRTVVFLDGRNRAALCRGCMKDRIRDEKGWAASSWQEDAAVKFETRHAEGVIS